MQEDNKAILTVSLVLLPCSWTQESKITPRILIGSQEGTRNPNPSRGRSFPLYSRLTTPTVTLRMSFRDVFKSDSVFGRIEDISSADNALITWSASILPLVVSQVIPLSGRRWSDLQPVSSCTSSPCCSKYGTQWSISVCSPFWKVHTLHFCFMLFSYKEPGFGLVVSENNEIQTRWFYF